MINKEEYIKEHLRNLGFTSTLTGFNYLAKAIEIVAEDYLYIGRMRELKAKIVYDHNIKAYRNGYKLISSDNIMINIRYCILDWHLAVKEDPFNNHIELWLSEYNNKPMPNKIKEVIAIIASNIRDLI